MIQKFKPFVSSYCGSGFRVQGFITCCFPENKHPNKHRHDPYGENPSEACDCGPNALSLDPQPESWLTKNPGSKVPKPWTITTKSNCSRQGEHVEYESSKTHLELER